MPAHLMSDINQVVLEMIFQGRPLAYVSHKEEENKKLTF